MVRVSGSELDDVRVHSTKDAALEFAVDAGHKYVPVRKGETITEAIARYAADRSAKAGRVDKPAGRPIRDEPQA
jgi:hypothetical protein